MLELKSYLSLVHFSLAMASGSRQVAGVPGDAESEVSASPEIQESIPSTSSQLPSQHTPTPIPVHQAPPPPTPADVMQMMAEFFQRFQPQPPPPPQSPRISILERLKRLGAEDFYGKGQIAATDAEEWLNKVERLFEITHSPPEEKLEGAVALFQGPAFVWWDTVRRHTPPEQVTWDFFYEQFRDKFVGREYIRSMEEAFWRLRQGTRTI